MTEPERRFTGPVRWATIVALALVILVVLFTVVFPWLERNLSNPTLGSAPPAILGG